MRDLFHAEWIKIAGNRWVAGCLVWIFPLLAVGFVVVVGVILSLSSAARHGFQGDTPAQWTEQAIGVWNIPNNPVGRLILLGFTAVVFAGEYQWNTWKNIVPRNRRVMLIVIKFVALGVFVVLAFLLMSILWTLGYGLLTQIAGTTYGPRISEKVLSSFAGDYALAASLAFTSTLIAAGYAALAGLFTRSILGGVLVGFAATFIENLSILGLVIVGYFLDIPRIVHLYRLTPGYNLQNVASWINDHHAANMKVDVSNKISYMFSDSLTFSVVLLAAWILGLIALTAFLFRRQDITS
jgi:ABC-2 type transport system permease protein